MLKRLYVNNFRCLDNFELDLAGEKSSLLIGRNGSGKSTIAKVLKIFQSIGRGVSRVGSLVSSSDFSLGRTNVPIRIEMEVLLSGQIYQYGLALELPDRFREVRVLEENLKVDGEVVYSRDLAQILLRRSSVPAQEAKFSIDWHLVALPVIQDSSASQALDVLRSWLASMVLLAPIPRLIDGSATEETLNIEDAGENFADWLSSLLSQYPAAYMIIWNYLEQVMDDLAEFRFERIGKEAKALLVRFDRDGIGHEFDFDDLSDGEKCFFLCAVVLAANSCYGPLFVFWDEPDNYLSLNEVGHFVMALRQAFNKQGQIVVTSHNEEAIRRFSNENTWVLGRCSHVEPSRIRRLRDFALGDKKDLVQAIMLGELQQW